MWFNHSAFLININNSFQDWFPGCLQLELNGTGSEQTIISCADACSKQGLGEVLPFLNPLCTLYSTDGVFRSTLQACGNARAAKWVYDLGGATMMVSVALCYTVLSLAVGMWRHRRTTFQDVADLPEDARLMRLMRIDSVWDAPPWSFARCCFQQRHLPLHLVATLNLRLALVAALQERWSNIYGTFVFLRSGQPLFVLINTLAIGCTGDFLHTGNIQAVLTSLQHCAPSLALLRSQWTLPFHEGTLAVLLTSISFSYLWAASDMDAMEAAGFLLYSMGSSMYSIYSGALTIELEAALKATGAQSPSIILQMAVERKLSKNKVLNVCRILRMLDPLQVWCLLASVWLTEGGVALVVAMSMFVAVVMPLVFVYALFTEPERFLPGLRLLDWSPPQRVTATLWCLWPYFASRCFWFFCCPPAPYALIIQEPRVRGCAFLVMFLRSGLTLLLLIYTGYLWSCYYAVLEIVYLVSKNPLGLEFTLAGVVNSATVFTCLFAAATQLFMTRPSRRRWFDHVGQELHEELQHFTEDKAEEFLETEQVLVAGDGGSAGSISMTIYSAGSVRGRGTRASV